MKSEGEAARPLRVVLAFVVPAALAGALVLTLTGGGGDPADVTSTQPRSISATPDAGRPPREAASSRVRRVVTGAPATTTTAGIEPNHARPGIPDAIAIPDLGVDVTIKPVGSTDDGIRVPPVYEAGWYRSGPRPGEPGRAIVLGHLDSIDGPAAFTPVPEARPDSEVTITDRDGSLHTFRVLRTLEVPKSSFPAEEVYGSTRRPSLALITCGGEFDPETGYENNVIVFARELHRIHGPRRTRP